MRKSDRVLKARNEFVKIYGLKTLQVLAAIHQSENGMDVTVPNTRSVATYKANLTRGAYAPFVRAGFKNDKLNLITCTR